MMNTGPLLRRIQGFESTAYAWRGKRIVWAGENAGIEHPRNAHRPWQSAPLECDAQQLRAGAHLALTALDELPAKGLLLWLGGRPLPVPLEHAASRFKAIRDALAHNDLPAFATAAPRVLGLGPGLTPSGDDFLGGIFFALAHAPRRAWLAQLPAVQADLRERCQTATNVISAALLDDLMHGSSYRALHVCLAALQDGQRSDIVASAQGVLRIGATSGADLLAGLLLALITTPDPSSERAAP